MNETQKKVKPSLASLLADQSISTGRDLIKQLEKKEQEKEQEKEQDRVLQQEAIEFEQRNRRVKLAVRNH
jgi:hypothetical protein